MKKDRILALMCRIDDIFIGEAMDDIGEALKLIVALYLFDQKEPVSAGFFRDVLALCEDYKDAAKKMTPDRIKLRLKAKDEIIRRLSGH